VLMLLARGEQEIGDDNGHSLEDVMAEADEVLAEN
jgi:hypothetical protein